MTLTGGSRTISITGAGLGSEFLGVAVYDALGFGSPRLAALNLWGLDVLGSATCSRSSPTFLSLFGPGGPVLVPSLPEMPRSVGKLDPLANVLLSNAIWQLSTNHTTFPGALNVPWFPSPAGNSGSNGTGINGGFVIPLPPLASLVGIQIYLWSWPTDPSNSFLDFGVNGGHSNTNGYDVLFFP